MAKIGLMRPVGRGTKFSELAYLSGGEAPERWLGERKVMKLILQGKHLTDIAKELSISAKTVSTYKSRIMAKLGVENNTELVIHGMLTFGMGGIYMEKIEE